MLKGRARAARARLPVAASAVRPAAKSSAGKHSPAWPEPELEQVKHLWLCIAFSDSSEDLPSEALSQWAYGYTPVLNSAPGRLFLEVGSSLRLFGGLQALRQRIEGELAAWGYRAKLACALTPRGAHWLALDGQAVACLNTTALRSAIAGLPLGVSGWPAKVQKSLGQMGLRTLGCCMKLPRDGFARRVGAQYLHMLDEALGRRPQLLRYYTPPLRFCQRHDLDEETFDHALMLLVAGELFTQLGLFLRRRQAMVQRFTLTLGHYEQAPTVLQVGTGRPCTETDGLTELVSLQLERLCLPAPVTLLQLTALAAAAPESVSFVLPGIEVEQSVAETEHCAQLLARLRARLGDARVYRLGLIAEHRPENAWQIADPGARYDLAAEDELQRPLWLLAQPQRIAAPAVQLRARAAERIETGWWDGFDIRRDYYQVSSPNGSCWWVYQDCRDAAWYLHGLFG